MKTILSLFNLVFLSYHVGCKDGTFVIGKRRSETRDGIRYSNQRKGIEWNVKWYAGSKYFEPKDLG